jgi:hypothetical protein
VITANYSGRRIVVLLAAGFMVCSGCHKDQAPPPPQIYGVTVDIPKLTQAFDNASAETKATVTQVGFNIRYTKYEDALKGLDKLLNDPSTTEEQKKVVNAVIEQVKKLAGSSQTPTQ